MPVIWVAPVEVLNAVMLETTEASGSLCEVKLSAALFLGRSVV